MNSKTWWMIAMCIALVVIVAWQRRYLNMVDTDKGQERKARAAMSSGAPPAGSRQATFGNGCFWCTEAIFQQLKGVYTVTSGYSGGSVANPTYEQVCAGATGHAEVIQITYDPNEISFADL